MKLQDFLCYFPFTRLMADGINAPMLDAAVRSFIFEILIRHSHNASILCDKDPYVLKYTTYIASIFPRSKFLLLVRDARAVVHSVMSRKLPITDFNLTDYRHNFKSWNKGVEIMVDQCIQVGKKKCQIVRYEQLVLQPKRTIVTVLKFLGLPWADAMLNHEKFIGTKISLSK